MMIAPSSRSSLVAHLVAVAHGDDLAGVGGDPHVALVHLDVAEGGAAQRLAGLAARGRELREAADDEVGGDAFWGAHWPRSIGADGKTIPPFASARSRSCTGDRGVPDVPAHDAAAHPVGARGAAGADHRPGARHHRAGAQAAVRGSRRAQARHLAGAARHRRATRSMLERFAFAAVAKCYPGRVPGGRGDRAPDRGERENCRPWTDALVRLCDPAVVVPGRAPRDRRLARAARRSPRSSGRRFESDGRVIVPLPHPSGASAWTNDPANRALVAEAVCTAARHDPLTSCHEGVTGAGPSVPCRGTRPGTVETAALWGLLALLLLIAAALLGARPRARPRTVARRRAPPRRAQLAPDARRARAAQPAAARADRPRAAAPRARARRARRRRRGAGLDELPPRPLRPLRPGGAGAARARRTRRAPAPSSSSGRTTRTRRPATCRWPRCAATTTTTGRA